MATRLERLRKLRRLEAKTEGVTAAVAELADQRRALVFERGLRRLEDQDLWTLGGVIERATAAVEAGDAAPVDLYRYAGDARDRRALKRFDQALGEELTRGA